MFTEDREAFLRDFGEVATLTVSPTVSRSVTVIFNFETDISYLSPTRDAPLAFDDVPTIYGITSEFSDVFKGAVISIRNKSYRLKDDPRDNSTGFFSSELLEV